MVVTTSCSKFLPPSIFHEYLIKSILKTEPNSLPFIFIEESIIPIDSYLKLFPKIDHLVIPSKPLDVNLLTIASYFSPNNKLIFLTDFLNTLVVQDILNRYNHLFYEYDEIQVLPYYSIDADSSSVSLIQDIKSNNFSNFCKFLPSQANNLIAEQIFNDYRRAFGLEEHNDSPWREDFLSNKLFKINDLIICKEKIYKVIDLKTNYLVVSDKFGVIERKWVTDCQLTDSKEDFIIEKVDFKKRKAKIKLNNKEEN